MDRLLLILFLSSCSSSVVTKKITRAEFEASIADVAAKSTCAKYRWKDRGLAPIGYLKGVSLVYAKNRCALDAKDPAALEMAKPIAASSKDALYWYSLSGADPKVNLRKLFTIAIGLGPRESSGKYCCGIDRSSDRWKAYLAGTPIDAKSSMGVEAGTFQTSLNAIGAVDLYSKPAAEQMRGLLKKYQADKSQCYLEAFKEGTQTTNPKGSHYCSPENLKSYGTGAGLQYQELSKACPAFHTEFTLITMRNRRDHHGPLNNKAAEFRAECEDTLTQIDALIDLKGCP